MKNINFKIEKPSPLSSSFGTWGGINNSRGIFDMCFLSPSITHSYLSSLAHPSMYVPLVLLFLLGNVFKGLSVITLLIRDLIKMFLNLQSFFKALLTRMLHDS